MGKWERERKKENIEQVASNVLAECRFGLCPLLCKYLQQPLATIFRVQIDVECYYKIWGIAQLKSLFVFVLQRE